MKNSIKKLCVFCGSGLGNSLEFIRKAQDLGTLLTKNGITLVGNNGVRYTHYTKCSLIDTMPTVLTRPILSNIHFSVKKCVERA